MDIYVCIDIYISISRYSGIEKSLPPSFSFLYFHPAIPQVKSVLSYCTYKLPYLQTLPFGSSRAGSSTPCVSARSSGGEQRNENRQKIPCPLAYLPVCSGISPSLQTAVPLLVRARSTARQGMAIAWHGNSMAYPVLFVKQRNFKCWC